MRLVFPNADPPPLCEDHARRRSGSVNKGMLQQMEAKGRLTLEVCISPDEIATILTTLPNNFLHDLLQQSFRNNCRKQSTGFVVKNDSSWQWIWCTLPLNYGYADALALETDG